MHDGCLVSDTDGQKAPWATSSYHSLGLPGASADPPFDESSPSLADVTRLYTTKQPTPPQEKQEEKESNNERKLHSKRISSVRNTTAVQTGGEPLRIPASR